MGIANPVTRETHGSGTHYHMQLAKQLGDMLQAPLEVSEHMCFQQLITLSVTVTQILWLNICCTFVGTNKPYMLYQHRNDKCTFISYYCVFFHLQERGGMMALTEVYCLVNRARGMEVHIQAA